MAELLRMENISKRFGSFYANKNVTFDVHIRAMCSALKMIRWK